MLRRLLAVLLLPLSAVVWSADSGLVPVPALTARVTDLTQTLTPQDSAALEQKLAAFEQQKGSQIAVLVVPTTQPEAIEQYAIRVLDVWKLGRAKVDDGALLIIAKSDRRLRIEVGRGLEGVLPDAIAKRIIAETITPHFKQGDFAGGINAGVDQMIAVIQGEVLPPPARRRERGEGDDRLAMLFAPFIILFFIGSGLRRSVGTFPASGLVGVGSGIAASFLLGSVLLGAGLGVIALIAALVMYSGSLGAGGYYGGGGFGGGGLGGGGGFGGGGGGFGGGGSSGSW